MEWKSINGEMHRFLSHGHGSPSTWSPNTDVYECDTAMVVRMELSGVRREDLEVSLHERLLIVRGLRRDPCRSGKCSFRLMEIEYGYFERRVIIPTSIDARAARAQFTDGFLHINLPKVTSSKFSAAAVVLTLE